MACSMHSAKDKIQILLMHLFNSCLCSSLDCSASLSLSHTAQVQLCCHKTVQQSAVSVGAYTRLEPTTHISWNHVGFYAFPPLRSVASERIKNGMFIITPIAACVFFGIPSAHYIIAKYCHSPANAVNMYKALWLKKAYKCCTPLLNLLLLKLDAYAQPTLSHLEPQRATHRKQQRFPLPSLPGWEPWRGRLLHGVRNRCEKDVSSNSLRRARRLFGINLALCHGQNELSKQALKMGCCANMCTQKHKGASN